MKYRKNIILLLLPLFLFTACSIKEPESTIITPQNDGLIELSKQANDKFIDQNNATKEFFSKYFKPWDSSKLSYSKSDAMWGESYRNKKVYLENHTLATKEWFDKHMQNANFEDYNKQPVKAITLKNTNVRILPTISPMFYDPTKPGEGFPFDYNQNSLLKINTPLIVSHLSKDRAWAYVESATVGGWVEIGSIAFVDENFIKEFKTTNYYVAVEEKFPIYEPVFKEYVKVGTIFPKRGKKYIVAKNDDYQNAIITYIDLDEEKIEPMPLKYDSVNRIKILNQLLNEPYGWGGLLNNRDCSSFTQDFFAPFGKFLERNSKSQTTNGKYLDISNLSLEEKKDFIRKNGVPFSTLVYLKGHIMLYIGLKDNEPLVAHNLWSIRLKDDSGVKSRHIIGKSTITTLEAGKELKDFDEDSNILGRVLGIVIL